MKFNERLLELRKQKGWSQEELSYKLEVSRQTISKWESGQTTPELEKLRILSKIFEITVDDLIKDTDEKNEDSEKNGTKKAPKKKSKLKILLIIILIGMLLLYLSIVVFRYIILSKINENIFEHALSEKVFFNCYVDKRESSTTNNTTIGGERTEYYYAKNNEDKFILKVVKYKPGNFLTPNKEIYIDTNELKPYEYKSENDSSINNLDENIMYVYDDVVEIDLENNSYSVLNHYYQEIYNYIIFSEFESAFYKAEYPNYITAIKNNIIMAFNFKIKVSKTENGYSITNNSNRNEDYTTILIDELNNNITLVKKDFDENTKANSKTTTFILKYEKQINSEDVTIPDLSAYTLIQK